MTRFTEEQRIEEGLAEGRIPLPQRLGKDDLAEALEILERLRNRPPNEDIPTYCVHGCSREGWLLTDREDGTTVAEGCPIHKPDFQYLDDRTDRTPRPALSPEAVKEKEKGSWYD